MKFCKKDFTISIVKWETVKLIKYILLYMFHQQDRIQGLAHRTTQGSIHMLQKVPLHNIQDLWQGMTLRSFHKHIYRLRIDYFQAQNTQGCRTDLW